MTTAGPLARPGSSGTGSWPWLISAAEMALQPPGILQPAHQQAAGYAYFPRLATRTPARNPAAVGTARDFAKHTLRRWGVAGRCDDIAAVLSELLANALSHASPRPGGWPVRVGLLQPFPTPGVLCAVADPSPSPPALRPADLLAESGRGLHLVGELSDQWGYITHRHLGKVVWAAFAATKTHPAT